MTASVIAAKPDLEGVIASITAPDFPKPGPKAYFTFSIERASPMPPGRQVLSLELDHRYADAVIAVIAAAFASGVSVQIGLNGTEKDEWRTVQWVQAVKR